MKNEIVCTTGTSIENYLTWVKNEIAKKDYGEVTIVFTINSHQVVDVKKSSMDHDHYVLAKKDK